MDPIRRTAGKKPNAAAWTHAVRGNSKTRLCRLLFGTGKVTFAVAPAEIRDRKGDLRVTRGDAT